MKWYFQSCLVDDNGKPGEILISLRNKKKSANALWNSTNSFWKQRGAKLENNYSDKIKDKTVTSLAEIIDQNVFR